MEFSQALLEQLLTPELARFDRFGQEGDGWWSAYDAGNDEYVRAPSRAELIHRLARSSDYVDLSARPRFNGAPVLIAEVICEDGFFRWQIVDGDGRQYTSTRTYPDHTSAVAGLASSYDEDRG